MGICYSISSFTGHLNQHPRTAIAAMKAGRKDYTEFYREIIDRDD